jgi:nicotinic acid mononucleotide adenylyltransferase
MGTRNDAMVLEWQVTIVGSTFDPLDKFHLVAASGGQKSKTVKRLNKVACSAIHEHQHLIPTTMQPLINRPEALELVVSANTSSSSIEGMW